MRRLVVGTMALGTTGMLLVTGAAVAGGPTDPLGGEETVGRAGGLKYLTERLAVGSSGHFDPGNEAAWMACGPHDSKVRPTAGGARVSGPAEDAMLAAMRPIDLDDAFETPPDSKADDWWDSTVRAVPDRILTGYAICSRKNFRYASVETPDDPTPERTGAAACPAGLHLVGGGAFIATSNSWINSSYPAADDTWHSRVFDTVGGMGGMSTNAVCRKPGGVQTVIKKNPKLPAESPGTATARCPSDRHAIGGGGRLTGPIGTGHLAASFPVDGRDRGTAPDDGWKAVGFNAAVASTKRLFAYVLCVRMG